MRANSLSTVCQLRSKSFFFAPRYARVNEFRKFRRDSAAERNRFRLGRAHPFDTAASRRTIVDSDDLRYSSKVSVKVIG